MKALKLKHRRIQSLMLTAVMLGSIFIATTGWTEGAGNFHFWDGDSYAIDFTGTLSDYHNTDSHADKTKAMIHAATTCVMDIAEPSVDADGRGTSLKIASSGSTYTTMLLSSDEKEALTDNYQVNFSVLTQGVEASVDTGTSSALVHLARIDQEGNVIIGVQKSSGEAVCKVDTDKWVDFEEMIVLRDGVNKLYYTVKQGDAALASGSVAMTLLTGKPLDGFSLKRVGVKRYAAATDDNYSTPTYFDDLSIRKYTGEIELLHYDFESSTTLSDYNKAAVNGVASAAIGARMEGDSHGNTLKLSRKADATEKALLPLHFRLA